MEARDRVAPPPATQAEASIPPAYRDIARLQVLCLLQRDGILASDSDKSRLCGEVARSAGVGTDLPVEIIATGDPKVVASGGLTLLVHGSLDRAGQLAFTIRPYRPAASGSDILFGSMPRIAEFADDSGLEAAIAASLDEVLPWRRKLTGVRRLD